MDTIKLWIRCDQDYVSFKCATNARRDRPARTRRVQLSSGWTVGHSWRLAWPCIPAREPAPDRRTPHSMGRNAAQPRRPDLAVLAGDCRGVSPDVIRLSPPARISRPFHEWVELRDSIVARLADGSLASRSRPRCDERSPSPDPATISRPYAAVTSVRLGRNSSLSRARARLKRERTVPIEIPVASAISS